MSVDLTAIRRAAEELKTVVQRTPVEYSGALSDRAGAQVWLKCENLQTGGSFKLRGSYIRMSRLSREERQAGVLAASAGNHAQGVALAARLLGVAATIYMPEGAALPKVAATEGYGAEVRLHGATVADAMSAARAEAERTGQVIIHPFDHEDIVLGQATVALEIAEQVPEARTIVVPTGGGGLLAGIATAAHGTLGPEAEVVGVQADGAAAYPASLAQGRPVSLDSMHTMADGIAIAQPGQVPLEIVRRQVRRIHTVSEEDLSRALLLLAERAKMIVEPSGGAGVADLMRRPGEFTGPVVVILSGGNIDPLVLMKVLRHGMVAAGRFLQFQVRVQDTPGHLAGLLHSLAGLDANVLEVGHVRTNAGLAVDEVDIAVECETKGPGHCAEVLAALEQAGYRVLEQ